MYKIIEICKMDSSPHCAKRLRKNKNLNLNYRIPVFQNHGLVTIMMKALRCLKINSLT